MPHPQVAEARASAARELRSIESQVETELQEAQNEFALEAPRPAEPGPNEAAEAQLMMEVMATLEMDDEWRNWRDGQGQIGNPRAAPMSSTKPIMQEREFRAPNLDGVALEEDFPRQHACAVTSPLMSPSDSLMSPSDSLDRLREHNTGTEVREARKCCVDSSFLISFFSFVPPPLELLYEQPMLIQICLGSNPGFNAFFLGPYRARGKEEGRARPGDG